MQTTGKSPTDPQAVNATTPTCTPTRVRVRSHMDPPVQLRTVPTPNPWKHHTTNANETLAARPETTLPIALAPGQRPLITTAPGMHCRHTSSTHHHSTSARRTQTTVITAEARSPTTRQDMSMRRVAQPLSPPRCAAQATRPVHVSAATHRGISIGPLEADTGTRSRGNGAGAPPDRLNGVVAGRRREAPLTRVQSTHAEVETRPSKHGRRPLPPEAAQACKTMADDPNIQNDVSTTAPTCQTLLPPDARTEVCTLVREPLTDKKQHPYRPSSTPVQTSAAAIRHSTDQASTHPPTCEAAQACKTVADDPNIKNDVSTTAPTRQTLLQATTSTHPPT
jgi:hypothetical protein